MRLPKAGLVLACLAVAFLGQISPAVAQVDPGGFISPNGNPSGPSSATSTVQFDGNRYTVSLWPPLATGAFEIPPIQEGQPQFTLAQIANNALGAQGSAWSVTGGFQIQGNYQLDQYYAWAGSRGALQQGAFNANAVNSPGNDTTMGAGGAVIGIHYLPAAGDPVNVHWFQLIYTNVPMGNVPTWHYPGDAPNNVWYADNSGGASPFYDALGMADATDFLDSPSRPYSNGSFWRGYLFLATSDFLIQTFDLSNVAYYGFDDPITPVPEPGTLVLSLFGGTVLSGVWLRRKARRQNETSAAT